MIQMIICQQASEYDWEIPQSHTLQTNQGHCVEDPKNTNRHQKTIKVMQPAPSSSSKGLLN